MLDIMTETKTLETRNLQFTRKNIDKIAYHYDAEVVNFDQSIKIATLKDHRGRLLWVQATISGPPKRTKTYLDTFCK